MKKLFYSLAAVICIAVVTAVAYSMFSSAGNKERITYVAFGDSIAAGYGLEGYSDEQKDSPKDSYQTILADFLNTTSHNYAVTGDDSDDCIKILTSGKADNILAKADIITVSIGSNDLLKPFVEIVKQAYGIKEDDEGKIDYSSIEAYYSKLDLSSILDVINMTNQLAGELEDNQILYDKAQAFSGKFDEIIKLIKKKAPNAEIYVTNIYNPFREVTVLGDLTETYIQEINQAFKEDSEEYVLIDLYKEFKESNLTNVKFDISDLSDINLDPHPSKEGHKKIASLITGVLKDKYSPKDASISKLKSTAKNSVTIKAVCSSDRTGYEVKYAASKNGKWTALKTTTKSTVKINSDKLKSGKVYYFKVRNFKEIKGVKYFSTYSKVKKAKIK